MTLDSIRHAAVHRRESLRLPRGLHRTRVSEMRLPEACAAAKPGRPRPSQCQPPSVKPRIIGTCLAYDPASPVVAMRWPWLARDAAD